MQQFYNDQNLWDAGPKPKYPVKTIRQIAEHFPGLPIVDLWHNPKMGFLKIATYDQAEAMFDNGQITPLQWDAYQAIWRNLTHHLSNLSILFEIAEATS